MICTLWPVFLSAPAARAGTWHLTATGNGAAHTSVNPKAQTWTAPAPADGSITLPGLGKTATTSIPGQSVSADASFSATVTATWVPDPSLPTDPVPTSVVVAETSTATATQGGTDASGQNVSQIGPADDGLHDTQDPSTGTAQGTHYVTEAPSGGTFQVSLSLSASGGFTAGAGGVTPQGVSYSGSASCAASVGAATVSAVSPIVNLTGTTVDTSDGSQNILIGQHCGASLSGIPSGNGWSVTYQWFVSGTTFQTWSATTPQIGTTPANPNASYYVDGPGPLTNPTAGWYWDDPSRTTETVSCTATATPPPSEGSNFTVTATKKVKVWLPNWSANATAGTMQVVAKSDGTNTSYSLSAYPDQIHNGGIDTLASVNSPNTTFFGDGAIEMVQLATPGLKYWIGSDEYDWQHNYEFGLDTQYPYPWTHQPPDPVGYEMLDSPSINLTGAGADRAMLEDGFQDYLMYLAPGSSQPVPLGNFGWTADGSATEPEPGGWAAFGTGSAGSLDPAGFTPFSPDNTFPMWDVINSATNGVFIKQ